MSAHSYCTDKLWTTKLQRIQNRSAADHKAVFSNLGHILSEQMLTDIFHSQQGTKAVGVDGITKGEYGKDLASNCAGLLKAIRNGSYRPKPSRIVEIAKADGGKRPLAISCFEDKLVQAVTKKILEALYEPLFKNSSHGFRPKRSCHTAIRELSSRLYSQRSGAVVEIDLRKCFNTIPHDKLFEIIGEKIKDARLLSLLKILVRAPNIAVDGKVQLNEIGCPQGSILSPLLCNIYLDVVLDQWFEGIQSYFKGKRQSQIRYCDDVVWIFEKQEDALRFFDVLPKRLGKYGLELNETKSGIIRSGSDYCKRLEKEKQQPAIFQFLGFEIFWCRTKYGTYRPRFKSQGRRRRDMLSRLKKYLRENLNTADFDKFRKGFYSKIRGWVKYHAVSDNQRMVSSFLQECQRLFFSWWNRRSQRRSIDWKRFDVVLKRLNFPKSPPIFRLYDFQRRSI